LSHLAPHEIKSLSDVCNQNGWFSLRRAKLDPILRQGGILYEDEAPTLLSLDEMVDKNRVHWLDHWLSDYAKTGATTDTIVASVAAWFAARKTLGALRLVHEMLVHIGRRKDLGILEVDLDPPEAIADAIRADATFAVKRRSLNWPLCAGPPNVSL
jgi:hypothetical protein